jgi:hypothetical protein
LHIGFQKLKYEGYKVDKVIKIKVSKKKGAIKINPYQENRAPGVDGCVIDLQYAPLCIYKCSYTSDLVGQTILFSYGNLTDF